MAASTDLMSLDADCLTCIIKYLSALSARHGHRRSPTPLKNFSQVNSQIRHLCLPVLFDLNNLILYWKSSESRLSPELAALSNFQFAVETMRALSIDRIEIKCSEPSDMSMELELEPNLIDFFAPIHNFLRKAAVLEELALNFLTNMSRPTKALFTASQFPTIKILHIMNVPDVSVLIAACPNLQTFSFSYSALGDRRLTSSSNPGAGMESTLQAISEHANITNVEISCEAWSIKHLSDITPYLSNIDNLCLSGEIKAKIGDLAPALEALSKLTVLHLTTDVWVNYGWYSKRYFDDRFLDAIDEAKEKSKLNEKVPVAAAAVFQACKHLTRLTLVKRWSTIEVEASRTENGRVQSVRSGEESDFVDITSTYKPFEARFDRYGQK